ncbi:MAG: hypothetical protein V1484_02405 [bacterium]
MASWYDDPEIIEIAKEVPAVFFDPNNLVNLAPPTDIWIDDPENLDTTSYFIHDQVKDRLEKFLGKCVPYLLAGYILEDGNRKRFLVLDNTRASIVETKLERVEVLDEQEELAILDVLNKYKISKVIEKTSKEIVYGDTTTQTGSSREVIGRSMLDKRREDMALINLAKKHGMTNIQYLRLKILADRLFKAGTQASLEEIAQSIVKEEDGENIPTTRANI